MADLLDELKPVKSKIFELSTIATLNEKDAIELINKNIHFTWWNKKEKSMETLPGKVIGYDNKRLKVFTYNITFDDDSVDEEHNKMIENIPIDEIKDYMIFENYTKEFWNLTEVVECDENERPLKKYYKVENIFGEILECIIELFDSFTIVLSYKSKDGKAIIVGYPLYFIKSIELISK